MELSIFCNLPLIIECHIKALIAHEFSKIYGVDEKLYLCNNCFSLNKGKNKKITSLITTCKNIINEGKNTNSIRYRKYIEHNLNRHGHDKLKMGLFGSWKVLHKIKI